MTTNVRSIFSQGPLYWCIVICTYKLSVGVPRDKNPSFRYRLFPTMQCGSLRGSLYLKVMSELEKKALQGLGMPKANERSPFNIQKNPRHLLTGKDLIVHITTFFSGTYFALPTLVLNFGESASLGTGTEISTLFATDCFLN